MDGTGESQGIVCDLEPGAARLFVTFGGLGGSPGSLPAALGRRDESVAGRTVRVTDHAAAWYHRGVAGVGPDVDSVAMHLREITADAEEVVMLGKSAGGYGALLFGALLGCEVHAFSPQTFIDPELRERHGDARWAAQAEGLREDLDHRFGDLLPVLRESQGRFHVYYASGSGLDALHAERLRELPQVTLHEFDYEGADMLRALRACGWLQSFVEAVVSGSSPPAPPAVMPAAPRRLPRRSDTEGIVCDLEPDSTRLFVSFGGLAGGAGVSPTFEFVRSFSSAPLKTVYVRDLAAAWYHRGVAGVGPDVDSVAMHLREITADAEEVVMVGNSAGGFGALLFGSLLGCEVHAFSPQTFIEPSLRQTHRDTRWESFVDALGTDLDHRYADLLPVLAESAGRFHVYYAARERLDAVHAERLGDLPQVTLHPFEYEGHDLVRALRASGWLRSFIDAQVTGSGAPSTSVELG